MEIVTRLARVEREVVDLRRDILDRRVARIERRLDLVDESTSSS